MNIDWVLNAVSWSISLWALCESRAAYKMSKRDALRTPEHTK